MKFAKWVFLIAGVYGVLVTAPLYFYEAQIAQILPPAITHPEYYYGFIGVTLAFQVVFLCLSTDPRRYRLMMLPCVIEKMTYVIAVFVLFFQQRISPLILGFALVDLCLGVLFVAAYWATRERN